MKKKNVLVIAAMIIIAAMLMLLTACPGEAEPEIEPGAADVETGTLEAGTEVESGAADLSKPQIVMTHEQEVYSVNALYIGIDNLSDDTYAYARWDDGENIDLEIDDQSGNFVINDVFGSKLEIFTNGEITTLECSERSLTNLDVTNCPTLTRLVCWSNELTSLDVSNNPALTYLDCGYNELAEIDVSSNTALTELVCYNNYLIALDVSSNTALTELVCYNNYLIALDVSNNTALTHLNCYNNYLDSLDISGNPALTELICWGNAITELDVSGNPALTTLTCSENALTEIDVSSNPALTTLICWGNAITALDVSGNPALTELVCCDNSMTALDLSNNTELSYFDCDDTVQLTGYGAGTDAPVPANQPLYARIGSYFDFVEDDVTCDFRDDPDGLLFGFEDYYWLGCSVWCAISSEEYVADASSSLPAQSGFSYEPDRLVDRDRATAWCEGVDGYGIGESFTVKRTLWKTPDDEVYNIWYEQLCILNGYTRDEKSWQDNSRVKKLSLWMDGVKVADLFLEDTINPQYFDLEAMNIVTCSGQPLSFTFVIEEVYPGDKYEDTCISGVEFSFGTPNH